MLVYILWVVPDLQAARLRRRLKNITGYDKALPRVLPLIVVPIEFFSNLLIRPFTHAVRLFANMFAGHMLLADVHDRQPGTC